jgi:hypothetical protein
LLILFIGYPDSKGLILCFLIQYLMEILLF